jgi:hypothetical protein
MYKRKTENRPITPGNMNVVLMMHRTGSCSIGLHPNQVAMSSIIVDHTRNNIACVPRLSSAQRPTIIGPQVTELAGILIAMHIKESHSSLVGIEHLAANNTATVKDRNFVIHVYLHRIKEKFHQKLLWQKLHVLLDQDDGYLKLLDIFS